MDANVLLEKALASLNSGAAQLRLLSSMRKDAATGAPQNTPAFEAVTESARVVGEIVERLAAVQFGPRP